MLSTIDQFKNNCPALNLRTSNISDSDIETIINQADNMVYLDLSNMYNINLIVSNITPFNLLSQYKSAEIGLSKFYGMSTRDSKDLSDVAYWRNMYNKLLQKIIKGLYIANSNGHKISPATNVAVDVQECTDIRTYYVEDESLET